MTEPNPQRTVPASLIVRLVLGQIVVTACLLAAVIVVGIDAKGDVQRQSREQAADLVTSQRAGCFRATADRLSTARARAGDVMRERRLGEVDLPAASRAVHRQSAADALVAARDYLGRAGIPADAAQGLEVETIRSLDADRPDVAAMRREFCRRAFP